MRDPFSWSIPLGRLFGISIRVHILFPIVALGLIMRTAYMKDPYGNTYINGTWIDVSMMCGLTALLVLLHEFGHCFAARSVNGEANEVLLWPLGGLASVDIPHSYRAHFFTAAAGPAVNFVIGLMLAVPFFFVNDQVLRPTWNPLWYPFRYDEAGKILLYTWGGAEYFTDQLGLILLARAFWINWLLFLVNMVLVGFPMDMGRMFQSVLWKYVGYRQATVAAIFAGFITALFVGIVAIVSNELLMLCLAAFIWLSCRQQWYILETGGEESLFGYDFSQGYTSLERDQPIAPPARRRQNWWQRWSQRRAAQKMKREIETREAEELRMDELLEKVQSQGLSALTDEERRFLKRVSDRYRNRH
jgi:stage IV sporulation protein FB